MKIGILSETLLAHHEIASVLAKVYESPPPFEKLNPRSGVYPLFLSPFSSPLSFLPFPSSIPLSLSPLLPVLPSPPSSPLPFSRSLPLPLPPSPLSSYFFIFPLMLSRLTKFMSYFTNYLVKYPLFILAHLLLFLLEPHLVLQ